MANLFPHSIDAAKVSISSADADDNCCSASVLLEFFDSPKSFDLLYLDQDLGNVELQTQRTLSVLDDLDAFSSVDLCVSLLNLFKFDDRLDVQLCAPILVAAALADDPNTLPYHCNIHFKKVVLHTARMICAHNYIFNESKNTFKKEEITQLLIAAYIHDLGHDGQGNIVDRHYEMARTEKQSFNLAKPYLLSAGLSPSVLDDLLIMLIGTDASPFGDPISPSQQIRRAFSYHFGDSDEGDDFLDLSSDFAVLEEREDLTLKCMILHEADLMNSIGLDYKITVEESLAVSEEIGSVATPESTLLFLEKTCCSQFCTDSGRYLGQNNFEVILKRVLDDYKSGNVPYTS